MTLEQRVEALEKSLLHMRRPIMRLTARLMNSVLLFDSN